MKKIRKPYQHHLILFHAVISLKKKKKRLYLKFLVNIQHVKCNVHKNQLKRFLGNIYTANFN